MYSCTRCSDYSNKQKKNKNIPLKGVIPLQTTKTINNNTTMALQRDAGCFHSNTLILMEGGIQKSVSDVQAGDSVQCDFLIPPTTATVVFVLKISSAHDVNLAELGEHTWLTLWHPVMQCNSPDNSFKFPNDIATTYHTLQSDRTILYNFVLSENHRVISGEYQCVTLGHCIENDPVASHSFFGTTHVIQALEALPEYTTGTVHFDSSPFQRSERDHLVCNLDASTSRAAVPAPLTNCKNKVIFQLTTHKITHTVQV